MRGLWLILALIVVGQAEAKPAVDACQLFKSHKEAKDVLITFAYIGAMPHGFYATSAACPRQNANVSFAIGHRRSATSFYRWIYMTPLIKSGVREIQATADYSGTELHVKRVHAYRELSESEARPFDLYSSAKDEATTLKAARQAAEDADAAAKR